MSSKHIFISAGELSGDIHGGNLIAAIKSKQPTVEISAIGGDNMAAAGAILLYHIRETSFMGFAEIIRHLPLIYRFWKKTLRHIHRSKPDLVVLIDYPGFNLRLAKAMSKRGIPVVYYISPQVWAWHQSRVKKIKKYTRLVLCILPFEESWLKEHGVNAKYLGHPLKDHLESVRSTATTEKIVKPKDSDILVGLFPGSRQQEVERHLPVMLESVRTLRKDFPGLHAAVAVAPDVNVAAFQSDPDMEWIQWLENQNHAIMQTADLLIMSSGTATLEAALYRTPLIVIYRLSNISYQMGKRLVKVPYISLVNLIAEEPAVAEFIQHDVTVDNILREARRILDDTNYRRQMIAYFDAVNEKLGPPGGSERVADEILSLLK